MKGGRATDDLSPKMCSVFSAFAFALAIEIRMLLSPRSRIVFLRLQRGGSNLGRPLYKLDRNAYLLALSLSPVVFIFNDKSIHRHTRFLLLLFFSLTAMLAIEKVENKMCSDNEAYRWLS